MLFEVEVGVAGESGHWERYRVIAKSMDQAVKTAQQQADADFKENDEQKVEVLSATLIDAADPIS